MVSSPEKRLYRETKQACERYGLAREGRVLVAMSGGKDSYTLAEMLLKLKRGKAIGAELVLVHLDQVQPGYDGEPLREWLEQTGAPFEIVRQDTYSVVMDKLSPEQTMCSLCSRLRRGVLYDVAERLGCNQVALGHHRDDAMETLLMNMFFNGRLQAMPAKFRSVDDRFDVIRPLINCAEDVIAAYAELRQFPILPCNLCGSQDGLQREEMKKLLRQLEVSHPDIKSSISSAMGHVRPTHLLDTDVADAWEASGGDAARGRWPFVTPRKQEGSSGLIPLRTKRVDGAE